MNDREFRLPRFYGEEEIPDVVRRGMIPLRDELTNALSRFLREKTLTDLNMFQSERVPMVVMRVETLHRLLDSFREAVRDENSYNKILKQAGEEIGISFAIDFMKLLYKQNRIPQDYNILFKTYMEHEAAGRWGNLMLDEIRLDSSEPPSVANVEITENFLSKGYTANEQPTRHFSFLEGYLEYALDELCLQWTSWLRREYPHLRVSFEIEIENATYKKTEDGKDTFVLKMSREKLPQCREELGRSVFLYYDNRYRESVTNMRTSMEVGIPEKVGIKKQENERLLWSPMLKVFRENSQRFPKSTISKLYAQASNVTHVDGREIKDIILTSFYYRVRKILKQIEAVEITKEQKREVLKRRGEFIQRGVRFGTS